MTTVGAKGSDGGSEPNRTAERPQGAKKKAAPSLWGGAAKSGGY